ncbi:MAG: glycosyltransferase family 9 protein [Thermodesulfobacteriota bacterium]|nr:glycosyltransferase family 9 protein [Thermodesulfobacteriota bacterium]
MKTLVINLTRFGDLLQTQPVLSALSAQGHEVGLVCLENFAPAASLLRDVDAVFALPGARFLANLDQDWRLSVQSFWEWGGSELRGFGPERVINLTASIPARLLTRFVSLGSDEVRATGFCLDEFGFGEHSSAWAAFLQASSRNRGCSPFNLVDLFWQAAECGPGPREFKLAIPDERARAEALAMLQAQAPEECKGFVAFQLGASAEVRRWPVSHFAGLAHKLWEEFSLCPVLLGSQGEAHLGQRFEGTINFPVVNLIGKTSFGELASVLTQARMLVTNDTGTMHLAAGLSCPVAAIFLATAQPWDTGPYAPGCLCLEPDMDCHPCGFSKSCPHNEACRQKITPESVFSMLRAYLESGSWDSGAAASGVRAWETSVQDGFMGLLSLSGHEDSDRTKWVRVQRGLYRQFLDCGRVEPWSGEAYALSPEMQGAVSRVLKQSERLLFLLCEQVNVLQKAPHQAVQRKFMENWQRLSSLWSQSPYFSVLSELWREESQSAGENIQDLPALMRRYHALVSMWRGVFGNNGMEFE